jgi:FlaA1/EpsC-like NDP-sugar epimerase
MSWPDRFLQAVLNALPFPQVLVRRLMLIALDAGLIVFSFWLSFALRLNEPFSPMFRSNLVLLPWAMAIGLSVLWISGWYRGLTRYTGSHALYTLLPRTSLVVLLVLLVSTLSGHDEPPFRAFWPVFWMLLSGSLIASRIILRDLLRYWFKALVPVQVAHSGGALPAPARIPTLVYGAGQAAALVLAELRHHPRIQLVAAVDDDPSLVGRRLQQLTIHSSSDLPVLIDRYGIRQVLLAIPSAPLARRRELALHLRGLGLTVLVMPCLARIATGEQSVTDLRPVTIEELLGRDSTSPDVDLLGLPVRGRSVLVTGAGGSIGSELCCQILRQQPARLVLLENNEFGLYAIEQELLRLLADQPGWASPPLLVPLLGDVRDQQRLRQLLVHHGVEVLFHAAAYKHVPLVEANICAGLSNNLLGTRSALEAAMACDLERFILISTDKAVRPTNVMGASKRACELLVQVAAARVAATSRGPVCAMVRFGNVLGSSGSVVPLFRQQIASGGPLTVTHPEVTRYFMTIPEAAQLVLQAAGLARGGEVFLLDMGEPVQILDLARQMIRLSGCRVRDEDHPDGEIAIRFTGLRPGEKLYEELLIGSTAQPTDHPLIHLAREADLPADELAQLMERMERALAAWDTEAVLAVLQEMVPEFQPRS